MVTPRVSGPGAGKITPAVVALFRKRQALEKIGETASEDYSATCSALFEALEGAPWEANPLETQGEAGPPGWMFYNPTRIKDWWRAHAIMQALEAAAASR